MTRLLPRFILVPSWKKWKSMEKLGLALHEQSFIYLAYISDFRIVDVSLLKIPEFPVKINLREATNFFTAPWSPEILIV